MTGAMLAKRVVSADTEFLTIYIVPDGGAAESCIVGELVSVRCIPR
jgi:hypothetical protein